MLAVSDIRIGIVVSRLCKTSQLRGAYGALMQMGCSESNIRLKYVPRDNNLALGTSFFAEYTEVDGVVVVACDRTEALAEALEHLQIRWNMPVAMYSSESDAEGLCDLIDMIQLQAEMADSAPVDANGALPPRSPRGNDIS